LPELEKMGLIWEKIAVIYFILPINTFRIQGVHFVRNARNVRKFGEKGKMSVIVSRKNGMKCQEFFSISQMNIFTICTVQSLTIFLTL